MCELCRSVIFSGTASCVETLMLSLCVPKRSQCLLITKKNFNRKMRSIAFLEEKKLMK